MKTAICQTGNPVNNDQKKTAKGLVYSRQHLKLKNKQETKETGRELTNNKQVNALYFLKAFFKIHCGLFV